jgi:hypothetical protein
MSRRLRQKPVVRQAGATEQLCPSRYQRQTRTTSKDDEKAPQKRAIEWPAAQNKQKRKQRRCSVADRRRWRQGKRKETFRRMGSSARHASSPPTSEGGQRWSNQRQRDTRESAPVDGRRARSGEESCGKRDRTEGGFGRQATVRDKPGVRAEGDWVLRSVVARRRRLHGPLRESVTTKRRSDQCS